MSRWWPEHIRIALHADRAALIRLGGRRRREIIERRVVSFADISGSPGAHGEAIGKALEQTKWRHGRIEVILSHALCKLALIPGGIEVRGRREEDALYRGCIEDANGNLPAHWRVEVAQAPAHQPRLACAVDGELIDALDAAANASGGTLASLRPWLVDAYNARRREIGLRHLWFATVENERCCIARIHNGVWKSLHDRRIFGDPQSALASLLKQERVLATDDLAPDGVLLCAPNHPRLRLPAGIAAADLKDLDADPCADVEAGEYGLALEGLR